MVFVDRGRRRIFLGDVGVFVRRRWRGKWWRRIQEGAGVPEVPEVPVQHYPPDEPNHVSIESSPSPHPAKRVYDITGYEAPYLEPRTKLQYANTDVFKTIRSLPSEYVQSYLALTNVAVVLRQLLPIQDAPSVALSEDET